MTRMQIRRLTRLAVKRRRSMQSEHNTFRQHLHSLLRERLGMPPSDKTPEWSDYQYGGVQ